jgi:hypothetical protein
MSIQVTHADSAPRRGTMDARLIFLVCFVPSLIHVVARRLVRGRTTNQSVICEAKAAAYTCVSFAFMG